MTEETTLYSVIKTLGYAYPLSLPEKAKFPCMVYKRISTIPQRNHEGVYLNKIRFQVTVWGRSYSSARELALNLISLLDINESDFIFSNLENRTDDKEDETNLYSIILDFFIWI